MNDYIQDQILESYLDEMDSIIESAQDEVLEFYTLTEADELAIKNNNDNAPAANKPGGGVKVKVKEMLQRLSELLKKFVAALERVGGILKDKAEKLGNIIANKFKVGGKVKEDTKIVKIDAALKNVEAINGIIKKVDDDIITPVESNQDPKNDDTGVYESEFEPLMYNTFIKDDNNSITYKKGTIVRPNVFNGRDLIVKISENSKARNKQYLSKLNTVIPTVEHSNEATENAKVLYKGLNVAIKYHQNMMKYNTKCIGDALTLTTNCDGVKAG